MTNKKSTKRALLLSVLSLVLCFSMLVGTTFAWFTDSVTSANNVIASGNLDIELYNGTDTNAAKITENTELFDEVTLWEPGVVAYENFTVANEGSLALKYVFSVNIANAKGSKNLADVLKVAVVENGIDEATADRDSLIASIGDNWMPFETFTKEGALDAVATDGKISTDVYGIVIWWEPTADDNDYNVKDLSIEIGVSLFATQLAAEEDAFGPDYDEGLVPGADFYATDAAELAEAIAEGGVVALRGDIVLTNNARAVASNFGFTIPADKSVVINLNGYNISSVCSNSDINGDGNITTADNHGIFCVKGNLTVIGEGTLSMQDTGDNMGWNALSTVFSVEGGELTLGEGVTVAHKGGTDMAYAVDVNTTGGETVLNVNGAILYSTYTGVRVFNNNKTAKGIVNYNSGIISGDNRDVWTQIMSAPAENAVVNTKIAYEKNEAGDRYYFDTDAVVVDADALKNALTNGKDVILINDLNNVAVDTTAPYGNKYGIALNGGVIDGNGNDLIFDSNSGDNYGIMTSGGTIKNVTVGGAFRGIVIMSAESDIIIDNVVIDNEDVCYAINTAEGDGTHSIAVSNSTLKGWTSIGTAVKEVSFTNCTFGQGTYYTNVYGRLVKPYVNATFKNCDFSSKYYIDLSALVADQTVVLENCTVNGVALTAENWTSLIAPESTCGEGQISIELRDGSYMTAENIADYIIIK